MSIIYRKNRWVLLVGLALAAGCGPDAQPPTAESDHVAGQCEDGCVLTETSSPLRGALTTPDSSGALLRLASFTALGDPGQVIQLQLTLDDHVLASLGPGVRIVVTMGDNEFRLPPRECTSEAC